MKTILKFALAFGALSLSGCILVKAAGQIAYEDKAYKSCQQGAGTASIHRRGCEKFDQVVPPEEEDQKKKKTKWKNRGED